MHPYVHCSIIYNYQDLEAAQVDEWIKQLWDIYTIEYYVAVQKEKKERKFYPLQQHGWPWRTLCSVK